MNKERGRIKIYGLRFGTLFPLAGLKSTKILTHNVPRGFTECTMTYLASRLHFQQMQQLQVTNWVDTNTSKEKNDQNHHRHRRLQRCVRELCGARLSILTLRVGIGAAIAEYLLNQSHNVTLIARTEKPLEELRKRYPKRSLVLAGDLRDISLAQKAVDMTLKKFGELDGVIVNHGMMDPVTKIETSDIEEWKKLFDVNFFSSVAFVSIDKPESVLLLTETGQGSYPNFAQEPRLRSFYLFGCFNRSILNMGRIRRFQGRH